MNRSLSSVYRYAMRSRSLFLLLLLTAANAFAQPGPPTFCFVLAEDRNALRPLSRAVQVVQHFSERVLYEGSPGSYLKPAEQLPLQAGPLFSEPTQRWRVYGPREGMAGSFVLITSGTDTLRIDLPEQVDSLAARAWRRWDRDTPEVIRFRKGHYALEALIAEPWNMLAATTLAERMIAEDDAAYKKGLAEQEAYYRSQPPLVPPGNTVPPRTPTREEIEHAIAQRPGLKAVHVDSVVGGNVWVRISGRVMLNGGCASGMPLYAVELQTDTGWVERIPFELIQMDCGLPWADWMDQPVMIPMAWWVRANSREGAGELEPGSYRLVFMGANMERMPTAAFRVE